MPQHPSRNRTTSSLQTAKNLAGLPLTAALLFSATPGTAQTAPPLTLTIQPNQIATPVSPMLYGMMTEEINHSYDGGLYAELINNRTFRGSWEGAVPWDLVRRGSSQARVERDKSDGPSKALPYSSRLTVTTASPGNEAGISNPGFWGIAVKPNTTFQGSLYAKVATTNPGPLTIRLIHDADNTTLAEQTVPLHEGDWSRYNYTLQSRAGAPDAANHIELTVAHPGTVSFQLVSLMPPTFGNRPNGNRPDLMERLAGMHPHFLRLPGGNYLEGDRLEDWYDWKKTTGPLVDRPGHQAPWTYWSTDGLGLLEFAEWCEDLKIEPVLAVYAGYALKGAHVDPGPALQPYVQSALDEVEYLTGSTSTTWGAKRAKDGHPTPFPLHYIEIGNEDWFDKSGSYDGRFAQFAQALRKQYPQYKLISTTPVKETATDAQPDLLDDHYYKTPAEMMDLVHHYDNAPRTGPKIFVGEWATRSGTPTPNFGDALGDAAWMTSMERNSDLIQLASYAPLLVNVSPGAMQWSTDLIGFNAQTTYASPSYYAQALFSAHLGDSTAKSSLTGVGTGPATDQGANATANTPERFFYSATVDTKQHILHLKLVNANTQPQPLTINLEGTQGQHRASITTLHAATYQATNSIQQPNIIHPTQSQATVAAANWQHTTPPLTIEVIDIPLK